ncbi:MAG: hypothetical protein EA385_03430 [Salinarimonadaceae bacterium]|nr:MAG: hypothetical protein EA385_03430 [Salinarimonadaceae bacterium]
MRFGALIVTAAALSACGSISGDGDGNPIANIFLYGGATVPPAMELPLVDAPCPQIDILPESAALRSYAGAQTNANLRSQVSIANVARECVVAEDGASFSIKVGVELRALLGPRGAPGRFDAPLRIVLRDNTQTFAERRARASVSVPQGATQASVIVIEEDMRVPAEIGSNYLIEVGIEGGRRR